MSCMMRIEFREEEYVKCSVILHCCFVVMWCDNIGLVLLIYLGYEICVVYNILPLCDTSGFTHSCRVCC